MNLPDDDLETIDTLPGNGFRPTGSVVLEKITDGFGKDISFENAIRYGWLKHSAALTAPSVAEVGAETPNLFVDQGRQLLTYCFGFRSPISNYTCQRFGVGTGLRAAQVTDVALQSAIALTSQAGATTAPISTVDFLTAFVVRIGFTVALTDANGYLITEFGLFSGNSTLMARKVQSVGINKTSDFAPTLTWRIRF